MNGGLLTRTCHINGSEKGNVAVVNAPPYAVPNEPLAARVAVAQLVAAKFDHALSIARVGQIRLQQLVENIRRELARNERRRRTENAEHIKRTRRRCCCDHSLTFTFTLRLWRSILAAV